MTERTMIMLMFGAMFGGPIGLLAYRWFNNPKWQSDRGRDRPRGTSWNMVSLNLFLLVVLVIQLVVLAIRGPGR